MSTPALFSTFPLVWKSKPCRRASTLAWISFMKLNQTFISCWRGYFSRQVWSVFTPAQKFLWNGTLLWGITQFFPILSKMMFANDCNYRYSMKIDCAMTLLKVNYSQRASVVRGFSWLLPIICCSFSPLLRVHMGFKIFFAISFFFNLLSNTTPLLPPFEISVPND